MPQPSSAAIGKLPEAATVFTGQRLTKTSAPRGCSAARQLRMRSEEGLTEITCVTGVALRALLAIAALALLLSCESQDSTVHQASTPVEQDLQITLGGFIQGHPEEGSLAGTCTPTDYSRSEMACDLYNGMSNWNITQATIVVVWAPYQDDNKRVYRLPLAIPSLTTQRVTFKLGFQLPPDSASRGERLTHWGWTYGPVRAYRGK